MHTRNNGFNTGRAGHGIITELGRQAALHRTDRPFPLGMASFGEGDDGLSSFTDKKDFNTYLNVQPFSQLKSFFIQGLTFEMGAWFCNVDDRALNNGCDRYRIQDHGDGGRQTLFDSGAGSIGEGWHIGLTPGVIWNIGPVTFRAMAHRQRSEDEGGTRGHKKGDSWLVGPTCSYGAPRVS